jgi:sec-independent protein translocase protein TatC
MFGEENEEGHEMSFLDHLEILRWHLIRSALAVISFAIIAFLNKSFLFDKIIFGPRNGDFISYRAMCKLSLILHNWLPNLVSADAICIGQNFPDLQNIDLTGQFLKHIMVSIIAGIIIAFPYIFWEFWRFLRPALSNNEKSAARGTVFFTSLLFFTGTLFGYFIISPLSMNFFFNYTVSESVDNIITMSSYISTITTVVLGCSIVFELPILVYFLTKVGLITPQFMKKYRKHALVGALILSAVITPPDVFSQLLVSAPLLILYEISIYISAFILKQESKSSVIVK